MSEKLLTLKPSEILGAGVGCFSVLPLEAGEELPAPRGVGPNRRLDISLIPDSHLKYCPLLKSGLYLAPADFAAMSVIWYINHSREPNLMADKWRLRAVRDIGPDEELTMYYPDLLTHPKNKLWVVPELHI